MKTSEVIDPAAYVHVAEHLLRFIGHAPEGPWHHADILCKAIAEELLKRWPHKELPKDCGLGRCSDGEILPLYIVLLRKEK